VHPSTLMILEQIGLLQKFEQLKQHRVSHLAGIVGGQKQEVIDLRGLKPFPYVALVPQWDFLALLAAEACLYPHFDLRMRHEAIDLVRESGRAAGVRVRSPDGDLEVRADLVVACDGRHSVVRDAARMHGDDYGAPMDVLWFRLARAKDDPADTFGIIDAGHMMVMLNRDDYWQIAYLVPKNGAESLRIQPIQVLRDTVAKLAPFLADRMNSLKSWDDIKTLEVVVDRLRRWHRPGLLLIGDAAHAMSPIGGVGINLAIQDAVAAANALAGPLCDGGPIDESVLASIQRRRMLPTRIVQAVQLTMQNRVISRVLGRSDQPLRVPALLRWLLQFRIVRHVPAWLFGYGFRRENVRTPHVLPPG
jgi:2-polyprenyl-6-methoxyphenol hydroxylase-like FAD-dependent oxidoreductase